MRNVPIVRFNQEFAFLSNMWPCRVAHPKHGYVFPSVENAYQWAKDVQPHRQEWVGQFLGCTPMRSKSLGRKAQLRPDWNKIKEEVMRRLLKIKFTKDSALAKLLDDTGNVDLVEGNYWHDNFWGSCTCAKCGNHGLNTLGRLLMEVRAANRSPR